MNFGMTDDSFLVKITNRPDFNNHIENQSIKKLKKFAKRLTMILLKFFYYFKLRIKRKIKIENDGICILDNNDKNLRKTEKYILKNNN